MKNRMIKVGNVVPSLKVADVSYNTEQIKQAILDHQDCSILLFPELCISGYTCADLFAHDALLEASKNALVDIASIVDQQLIVVGAALKYHNSLYNCAVYISQGKIIGVVPKIYIPTYSEFYESRWFTSGKEIKDTYIQFKNDKVPFSKALLVED